MSDWRLPDGLDRRLTPARADLAAQSLRGAVNAARYIVGERRRLAIEAEALRATPSHDAAWETQALYGEEVIVYDEQDGWAWVQALRDGYVGYLSACSLAPAEQATHRVHVPRTYVYPSANMKRPPVMALPMNALAAVRGESGRFAKIDDGFVWCDHLGEVNRSDSDFVAIARRFLHAPYLWGGRTSMGLDCSGLVQLALHACGYDCPRDTDMIAQAIGIAVALDTPAAGLHRGDLVFWKGHVGLVADGGQLLHASGHHMQVAEEPIERAVRRIAESGGGGVLAIRRLI